MDQVPVGASARISTFCDWYFACRLYWRSTGQQKTQYSSLEVQRWTARVQRQQLPRYNSTRFINSNYITKIGHHSNSRLYDFVPELSYNRRNIRPICGAVVGRNNGTRSQMRCTIRQLFHVPERMHLQNFLIKERMYNWAQDFALHAFLETGATLSTLQER